jgi:hypothetical protein
MRMAAKPSSVRAGFREGSEGIASTLSGFCSCSDGKLGTERLTCRMNEFADGMSKEASGPIQYRRNTFCLTGDMRGIVVIVVNVRDDLGPVRMTVRLQIRVIVSVRQLRSVLYGRRRCRTEATS